MNKDDFFKLFCPYHVVCEFFFDLNLNTVHISLMTSENRLLHFEVNNAFFEIIKSKLKAETKDYRLKSDPYKLDQFKTYIISKNFTVDIDDRPETLEVYIKNLFGFDEFLNLFNDMESFKLEAKIKTFKDLYE
jgi:hypothetical protein